MSIAVSFIFFSKPFVMQYVWSGLIIVLGIYLNMYSKQSKLTVADLKQRLLHLLDPQYNKKIDKEDDDERHQLMEV